MVFTYNLLIFQLVFYQWKYGVSHPFITRFVTFISCSFDCRVGTYCILIHRRCVILILHLLHAEVLEQQREGNCAGGSIL